MDTFDILVVIILDSLIVCFVVYWIIKKRFQYWTDRGVPQSQPELIFGNVREVTRTIHFAEKLRDIYNELKDKYPFAGMYQFFRPVALITDLELLKCVLVKDYQYFHDRGMYYNERDDPLSAHLFNIEGEKWKNLRQKITPTFSPGKMKMMLPTIVAAAKQLKDYMEDTIHGEMEIEVKNLTSRFTTDVIGMCAFGIECNSMRDPDGKFQLMGRKVFLPRKKIKSLMMHSVPRLAKMLKITSLEKHVSDFFMNVVRDTIDYRLENKVHRNDFMDILIRMFSEKDGKAKDGTLTFNEIAAQAFVFFLAGFETSSSLMAFALYELALHQDVQDEARRCVLEAMDRHDGKLTYEAALEMDYLDRVLKECLRMYPPISVHFRETTKDYMVPGTNTVLQAGTSVLVPVYAIHRDPNHFPDPDRFDPERFTPEEEAKRHPYAWTPFGEGPRICIGLRFGMMQVRIGIAQLLTGFRFSRGAKTLVPMKLDCRSFFLSAEGGMWLKVEHLK